MENGTAFCGLDCFQCDAFMATQANDEAAILAVVEKWKTAYGAKDITVRDVTCSGCLSQQEPLCLHCHECAIRACAGRRGVENCAWCLDFDTCQILGEFLKEVTAARDNLNAIRATFQGASHARIT